MKNKNSYIIDQDKFDKILEQKRAAQLEKNLIDKKSIFTIEKINNSDIDNFKSSDIIDNLIDPKNNQSNLTSLKFREQGFLFNVSKTHNGDHDTRFLVSYAGLKILQEYHIVGVDNDLDKNSSGSINTITFEASSIDPKDFIIIDGTRYEIYNGNNSVKKEKTKELPSLSDNWIENLSFTKGSFLKKISNRKLLDEEKDELLKSIQNSPLLSDSKKLLYLQLINSMKIIKIKDVYQLEKILTEKFEFLKTKDK